ncbi:hypothetical protein BWZ22_15085 [Seonamhaeicola sp. S2-3]|uniref:hypothetical protein n=1 Tax=Seonamhaeicola sp. S2-3 TaxID=1936081 RepID=UPI000972B64C|nr:hypothetical protein [Seonamhaeicola sp. S2-3]APY12464.1 hypothetical protein BWZ22_15085 [Seonamhaeicola sp. S2-3]
MSLNLTSYSLLIAEYTILTVLVIVVIFFSLLLILGIRKSYKLKKENERLDKISKEIARKKIEEYKDFTGGHMYQ